MKNQALHFIGCLGAATFLFASCNSSSTEGAYKSNSDSTTTNTATTTTVASQKGADTAFMFMAADAGMMEIELGKFAQQNAQNAQVKNFGAMMVADHTDAANELKSLATSEGITLPDSIKPEHRRMVEDMKKMKAKDFDKHYIDMMVSDHQKVIDGFKDESTSGKDSLVMAFASKTLPTLQKHLDAAKAAQQNLNNNP
jgi:putative membrane protein